MNIYTFQGTAVARNATVDDINALPAGVYVANGRKIAVK